MKRVMALVLAVMLMLTSVAALAQSSGSRMDIRKLKIRHVGAEKGERIRLHGLDLSVSIGSAEGVPTLQIALYYGDSQEIDFVMQVVDSRLLLCMGGISGIYYIDLKDVMGDEARGEQMAQSIGTALLMFGEDPQSTMETSMARSKKGAYIGRVEIPEEMYLTLATRLSGLLLGNANVGEEQMALVRDSMGEGYQPVALEMHKRDDAIWLYAWQGENGIRLSGWVTLTTEPMEFINISRDEVQHDLLNLNRETWGELQSEFQLLALQMGRFVIGTGILGLSE